MKTKHYLLAGAAVCFAPFGAHAADISAPAPVYKAPVVPPFTWTGPYLGVSAGIISQGTTVSLDVFPPPSTDASLGITGFGFIGGADIGYNWQFAPNWVIGLETDISGTSLDDDSRFFGTSLSSRLDTLGTVRARLGHAFFHRALLYATGGWAYGHVRNSVLPTPGSTKEWKSGWTAGAGLEYAITPNTWTVRAEVLYVDLGTTTINVVNPQVPVSGCRFGFKNRYVLGRVGLNYKF